MQQKVPFSLISCSSSKVAFCSCVEWGWHIYNIVESESDPLTRRAVDLFEKEPLKGNSEVHLHTPTKFGEDRSKDLGGDREQTDRQTNRQTDKRCSIYSMISLDHQSHKSNITARQTFKYHFSPKLRMLQFSCLFNREYYLQCWIRVRLTLSLVEWRSGLVLTLGWARVEVWVEVRVRIGYCWD